MKSLKDILVVVFLVTIVVMLIAAVVMESRNAENNIPPDPTAAGEEFLERKLEGWVPKMP